MAEFRSGIVGILGRPNVGKSTFLNSILGQKLAAVTNRPQTTRNRILGVQNFPDTQLAFMDTPGVFNPRDAMGSAMVSTAYSSMDQVDAILLMTDTQAYAQDEENYKVTIPATDLELIEKIQDSQTPCVLAINKIDRLELKDLLLPVIAAYIEKFPFKAAVPISARNGDGLPLLVKELAALVPEGPALFPEDMLTDRAERFFVCELTREQLFTMLNNEVPYCAEVEIDSFVEKKERVEIACTLMVQRDSQKKIIIGKGGAMIKQIGTSARIEIEKLLGIPVMLRLFVKVRKDWRKDPLVLEQLGILE